MEKTEIRKQDLTINPSVIEKLVFIAKKSISFEIRENEHELDYSRIEMFISMEVEKNFLTEGEAIKCIEEETLWHLIIYPERVNAYFEIMGSTFEYVIDEGYKELEKYHTEKRPIWKTKNK